jgi:hypothetical protein
MGLGPAVKGWKAEPVRAGSGADVRWPDVIIVGARSSVTTRYERIFISKTRNPTARSIMSIAAGVLS